MVLANIYMVLANYNQHIYIYIWFWPTLFMCETRMSTKHTPRPHSRTWSFISAMMGPITTVKAAARVCGGNWNVKLCEQKDRQV